MEALFGKVVSAMILPGDGLRSIQASARSQDASEEIKTNPTLTSTSTSLPLLSSRSGFPSPLQFLWFAKPQSATIKSDSSEVRMEDTLNVVSTTTDSSKKSWALWGIRSMWPEQIENDEIVNGKGQTAEKSEFPEAVCLECEMGTCDLYLDRPSLEVPHVPITHNQESFSRFLQALSLPEIKGISQLSFLCNLAYKIREIEPNELRVHHVEFVTSSLHRKREGSLTSSSKEQNGSVVADRFSISPSSAYALASAVASYLHFQTPVKKNSDGNLEQEEKEEENDTNGGDQSTPLIPSSTSSPIQEYTCPCEWYCCDDIRDQKIRYFFIQGSESLASWQTNLLFEPTHFEDTSLGVMVHRGIYEAAKGLYEQVLGCVKEYVEENGEESRICFAGHSLGGSIATLVTLMLQIRGVVKADRFLPVHTFGSPSIMCGGDYLLDKLSLPADFIRSVVLHRDIVPRIFACDYPDHVSEILKRFNSNFRDHPCLIRQKLLYAPMGQMMLLQPSENEGVSKHPLVPATYGMYRMQHPEADGTDARTDGRTERRWRMEIEIRAAQRAFLNSPHPLEILRDPGAYGGDGRICRDHHPRSYVKALDKVVKVESKKMRRDKRDKRRRLWWNLLSQQQRQRKKQEIVTAGSSSNVTGNTRKMTGHHVELGIILLISAKVMLTKGLAAFFAWV